MTAHATGILAIIPARGGSKGIPRKNVALLGGLPLLAHSIVQALRTPSITRVVVSTDDAEITAVATRWGAEVSARPAGLSGDTASSESALLHVLDSLRKSERYEPELVVFLQATSPLRRPDDIARAIATVRRDNHDSLFSAGPVHGFVWQNDVKGLRSVSYDHRYRPRRQDAPEELVENGSIYVFRPWVLRECGNRLGGSIGVHRMEPLDSFQVDEPGDLERLEMLLRLRSHRASDGVPARDLARIRLLILDFDGVMTNNRVWLNENAEESVMCDRSDGWGIARLREANVEVVVLSTERVQIAAARSKKLGIACIQACDDKLTTLRSLAAERALGPAEIAYVGNDVNDAACLGWVGVPVVVADAQDAVRSLARWVTARRGGEGAVREVADALIAARQERGAEAHSATEGMGVHPPQEAAT